MFKYPPGDQDGKGALVQGIVKEKEALDKLPYDRVLSYIHLTVRQRGYAAVAERLGKKADLAFIPGQDEYVGRIMALKDVIYSPGKELRRHI